MAPYKPTKKIPYPKMPGLFEKGSEDERRWIRLEDIWNELNNTWDKKSREAYRDLVCQARRQRDIHTALSTHPIAQGAKKPGELTWAHVVILQELDKDGFLSSPVLHRHIKKKYPGFRPGVYDFNEASRSNNRTGDPVALDDEGSDSDDSEPLAKKREHNPLDPRYLRPFVGSQASAPSPGIGPGASSYDTQGTAAPPSLQLSGSIMATQPSGFKDLRIQPADIFSGQMSAMREDLRHKTQALKDLKDTVDEQKKEIDHLKGHIRNMQLKQAAMETQDAFRKTDQDKEISDAMHTIKRFDNELRRLGSQSDKIYAILKARECPST